MQQADARQMHTGLEIRDEGDGARAIVAVSGEVDIATAGLLRAALKRAAAGDGDVWVDLTEVEFMDSTGLSALACCRSAIDGERRFAVICPSDGPVRRILTVSGFDCVLGIYPSRLAAQAA